jgi:hypothetical protein
MIEQQQFPTVTPSASPACQTSKTQHHPLLPLFLLACTAILIQGYHLGVNDSEIFLPAIKQIADPQLYPFGAEFFLTHARLSLFAPIIGHSARWLHLPADLAIFLWHIGSVFLILIAAWQIACLCFQNARARWSSVTLLAALLPIPVAGTALAIADNYLTPRSLSTPLAMLAIAALLRGRRASAALLLLLTALIHPQMAVYALVLCLLLSIPLQHLRKSHPEPKPDLATRALLLAPLSGSFVLRPAQGIYRQVLYTRTFFFASQWAWYEWLGAFAPLAILFCLSRLHPRATLPAFHRISRALLPFGAAATLIFIALSFSPRFENLVKLQPMRCFHLIYIVMFLLIGGLLGEYVLKSHPWRWIALFLSLAAGMFFLDQSTYPHSRHIEWPLAAPTNPWSEAFLWIRANTPKDAVFAIDPNYMAVDTEDQHGFRALAERSMLADNIKDSGAVTMFPNLIDDWQQQQEAQRGFTHFTLADYQRLASQYPVTWAVTQTPIAGLDCPYRNEQVAVCHIPMKN